MHSKHASARPAPPRPVPAPPGRGHGHVHGGQGRGQGRVHGGRDRGRGCASTADEVVAKVTSSFARSHPPPPLAGRPGDRPAADRRGPRRPHVLPHRRPAGAVLGPPRLRPAPLLGLPVALPAPARREAGGDHPHHPAHPGGPARQAAERGADRGKAGAPGALPAGRAGPPRAGGGAQPRGVLLAGRGGLRGRQEGEAPAGTATRRPAARDGH